MKSRAVFSSQNAGLTSHHAGSSEFSTSRQHHRRNDDDSLRLIDNLVNRPVDPLFADSRLVAKPVSKLSLWTTRIVVFFICVFVGFVGCLFVQLLHTDPRSAVRASLAADLEDQLAIFDEVTSEINDLRSQIDEETKALEDAYQSTTQEDDELTNGSVAVEGEGITLTLADPMAADDTSDDIQTVTDSDLQQWVSLLWQSGAEAIAVNGYRIGVQTSIRTAGSTILVGVNAVESPYTIEAIGDKDELADALSSNSLPSLYESYAEAGIYPQVVKSTSLTLEAAVSGSLTYAQRSE